MKVNNEIIFVRHAKTKLDKSIPIENWILTADGEKCAKELAKNEMFDNADILISSEEEKAFLTLEPLAKRLGKKIIKIKEFGEISRPGSEKLTSDEYEGMKIRIFQDMDFTAFGWETANHALNRFTDAVNRIDKKYEGKKIVICTHGTVMTLYFAKLAGKLDKLFERWDALDFGNYGMVENGRIVKDIVD